MATYQVHDTNAGLLQWEGEANSRENAIRKHLKDVGYDSREDVPGEVNLKAERA